MGTNYLSLQNCTLFEGVDEAEIQRVLVCLAGHERKYERDSYVFRADDNVRYVYLILSGSMHIIDEDFWGNRSIIEIMYSDTLFGEAYVFARKEKHLVSVVAAEDSVLLEIDPDKLFNTCSKGCACHGQLIRNMVGILSEKIVRLTEKTGHIMQRSLRDKLLSYLSKCARREGKSSFDIPYSRQELADYLCVDRSALSHELSRLQTAGAIEFRKNHFELLVEYHGTL